MLGCCTPFVTREVCGLPISAFFHRGPRGYFRSECCTGGESMAVPRENCSLTPIHQRRARGRTGRKYHFSSKCRVFLRCFRDPIWVPRIENRVPRIRENYDRVPRIIETNLYRVPNISLKKNLSKWKHGHYWKITSSCIVYTLFWNIWNNDFSLRLLTILFSWIRGSFKWNRM